MRNYFLFCLLCFVQLIMAQEMKAQQVISDSINQKISLLYYAKDPEYLTGSVSYISGDEVANVPGTNRPNTLSGRLTGFSCINIDGVSCYESSTIRIRNVHTFPTHRNPLILIDGRIDDTNRQEICMILNNRRNPADILRTKENAVLYLDSDSPVLLNKHPSKVCRLRKFIKLQFFCNKIVIFILYFWR
jgi:hypothetical protein